MSVFFALSAGILTIFWATFFFKCTDQILSKIALEKIYNNDFEINNKKKKIIAMRRKMETTDLIGRFLINLFNSEKSEIKEVKRLIKRGERLRAGQLRLLDMIPAMGYIVIDYFSIDSANTLFFKKTVEQNASISGRENAVDKTRYQLASAISYMVIGTGISLNVAALMISIDMGKQGLLVAGIGSMIVIVSSYLPLDNLKEKVAKRQDDIICDFPQVASKLTLLVGAGIDMTQAWLQTAQSGEGVIYLEMMNVINDIQNGISPYEAYNKFVYQCSNKYTSKLGVSIMQNLTKGNAEICLLLGEITSESWNDRRQYAKRKGELAQSKLLIPIMMMFFGIILLVVAPVMSSFGGMGL